MSDCQVDSRFMIADTYHETFPFRCYFYPGRDCPGWEAGGHCGRVGHQIPTDETSQPERGDW